MKKIILLSGLAGSGKSTTGNLFQSLNYGIHKDFDNSNINGWHNNGFYQENLARIISEQRENVDCLITVPCIFNINDNKNELIGHNIIFRYLDLDPSVCFSRFYNRSLNNKDWVKSRRDIIKVWMGATLNTPFLKNEIMGRVEIDACDTEKEVLDKLMNTILDKVNGNFEKFDYNDVTYYADTIKN